MKSPGCTRNFRCCHVACCRYLWYVHWCTVTNLTCATCAHIRDLCCAVAAGMFAWLRLSPEVACCTQKQLCTCPGACSARGPKRNGSSAQHCPIVAPHDHLRRTIVARHVSTHVDNFCLFWSSQGPFLSSRSSVLLAPLSRHRRTIVARQDPALFGNAQRCAIIRLHDHLRRTVAPLC